MDNTQYGVFILYNVPNQQYHAIGGLSNPYCTVANGLTDAGCDIDPNYTYDDIADNLIKVTENPIGQ